jgi:hypothetical protein
VCLTGPLKEKGKKGRGFEPLCLNPGLVSAKAGFSSDKSTLPVRGGVVKVRDVDLMFSLCPC